MTRRNRDATRPATMSPNDGEGLGTGEQRVAPRPDSGGPRVLLAAAECAPIVKVGGLGEAIQGLVSALRRAGADVELVLPDYGSHPFSGPEEVLDMPGWAEPATARRSVVAGLGSVTVVRSAPLARPHAYVDAQSGQPWPDNDERFFTFSAAVAALTRLRRPDVLHLNDWHTALTPGLLDDDERPPTVLTIHNLAYQGQAPDHWLDTVGPHRGAYLRHGEINPLAGALGLADRIVAVSPTYAREIRDERFGCGLDDLLAARGTDVRGIRNGIDVDVWSPASDPYLPAAFHADDLAGKAEARRALLELTPLQGGSDPIIAMASRFVHQKGVDLALDLVPFLATLPAQLVLIGEGEPALVARAARAAADDRDRVYYFARYREDFGHLVVAGADLLLAPSRFEPCGLTQMQAMSCGTIPVVTGVGGLADTVLDADRDRVAGNGFVAAQPELTHLLDALHRAVRALRNPRRRRTLQERAMRADWSWDTAAGQYRQLYTELAPAPARIDRVTSAA